MKLSKWCELHDCDVCDAAGDLYYLVKETLGVEPAVFSLTGELSPAQLMQLDDRYQALKMGKPLAYILGSQPFLDLECHVRQDVLIPRSDTEQWVRRLLDQKDHGSCEVLDIGTGSGCIALSLKYYRPSWTIWACDQSQMALDIAAYNAKKYSLDINFQHWDLFHLDQYSDLEQKKWDLIVSNPPYLTQHEWEKLPLLHAEPKSALVDREGDGLSCYRAILKYAQHALTPQGELWLEHGVEQRFSLGEEVKKMGMHLKACYSDDASRDRVMVCVV